MNNVAVRTLSIVVALGAVLLVVSSWPYLLPGLRHPFLFERMPLSLDTLWLTMLKAHVACGLTCLPMGLMLVARRVRERWPRLHRVLGRVYVGGVALLVPTGIYLAPYSKFGWASGSGFVASAAIIGFTTFDAIRAARVGNVRRHRSAAIHSVAQIASAISFRIYHLGFQLLHLPYETNYIASVWLSVAGNVVLAELWIRLNHERSHHETSDRHEPSVLRLVVER